jgi:hypothetical protein
MEDIKKTYAIILSHTRVIYFSDSVIIDNNAKIT